MLKNISKYVICSLLCVSLISCSGEKNDIAEQSIDTISNASNESTKEIIDKKTNIIITKNNESKINVTKENINAKEENKNIPENIESNSVKLFSNHKVVAGDTLWDLAQKYDIGWKYIYWNNLDLLASPSDLVLGQILQIPTEPIIIHKVKIGETLFDISSRYEVDIDQINIYRMNKVSDMDVISVGDEIYVPNGVVQFFEVTLSFYYCEDVNDPRYLTGDGGDFCEIMRNGQKVYPGAAACAYRFLGQKFVILNDPLKRTYECADTGNLVLGWHRDIWFNTNEEGWNWLRTVGTVGNIIILE